MRYTSLILIVLICSLGSLAQSNNKSKQGTIDALSTNIKNFAISPLDKEIQSLQNQIESVKSQIERIKNRKLVKKLDNSNIEEVLLGYTSINDIYLDRNNLREILGSEGNEMAQTYLLIIDLKESLEKAYNEKTNASLIERSSKYRSVLPQHNSEFEELVLLVNDYNYFMYELARLFAAADEDNYKTDAKELTVREDAEYLMKVPFTKKMLTEYIRKRGSLPQNYILDLKNGCPKAFSELK